MHRIIEETCVEMQGENSKFCLEGQGWLHQRGDTDLIWVEKVHWGRRKRRSTSVQM